MSLKIRNNSTGSPLKFLHVRSGIYRSVLLGSLLALLLSPATTFALSSSTYTIPQYDLPQGAGTLSSTNYGLQAEIAPNVGSLSGSTYSLDNGFPSTTGGVITLTLNASSVQMTLNPGTPTTTTSTLNVTTNDIAGYSLAVQKNQLLTHTVNSATTISDYSGSIATPTTWSGTGFGFSVASGTSLESKWSSGTKFAAIPTQTSTTFHAVNSAINASDATQITYELDTPASQRAGSYTTIVSYIATVAP